MLAEGWGPELTKTLGEAREASRGLEIAGVLVRAPGGKLRYWGAPSLADQPGCAEVPVWWLERAARQAEREGSELVAFLHSHATSLALSAADYLLRRRLSLPLVVVMFRGAEVLSRNSTAEEVVGP